jgi:heme A synthase
MSSGLRPSGERSLETSRNRIRERIRSHLFRVWTACAVLAAYVYGWLYFPEMLTWWKRMTTAMIEAGCDLLPYPWGDRIEATLGNFGLWVQITLAIIVFRLLMWLVWLVISALRRPRTPRDPQPRPSLPLQAEDRG